jgi:hypothetical protein
MESLFDLILDVDVQLELIQVDFDRLLDLLDHNQLPDSKKGR